MDVLEDQICNVVGLFLDIDLVADFGFIADGYQANPWGTTGRAGPTN